ncbi:unnamed protein product [Zymoseptoria tritici ST99CH_1E4]|uniref:Uncharacterized protein n=1 Tax=Zymoseptoria tritici ST99CH_1E4 TaxID=1276532 RepID=A0A2H1GQC2_ZYMTR|nr:unnamed protein product [Zymoseptoria tritici ST99CH_1E4]
MAEALTTALGSRLEAAVSWSAPTWDFSALGGNLPSLSAPPAPSSLSSPARVSAPPTQHATSPAPPPPSSLSSPARVSAPPTQHATSPAPPPPASLLSLSDELLSLVLSFAMIHTGSSRAVTSVFSYPSGVIPGDIHFSLRHLLGPLRCHPRLYAIAKHEFLRSNLAVLNCADIRASAVALIPPSGVTKHPTSVLLQSLTHIQLHVSVSDLRAPFTQRFSRQFVDMLNMDRECAELRMLSTYCPNLKSVHLFLKVDEWYLVAAGTDLRRNGRVKGMTEREVRYRERAETIVELAREVLPYRCLSVAFHHWDGGCELVDGREWSTSEVVEGILGGKPEETWRAPTIRLR